MNSVLIEQNSNLESYSQRVVSPKDMGVPKHIAIIMDGNRRWSQMRSLPKISGYLRGAQTLSKIVRAASDLGVEILTAYAFSTENWKRSPMEIKALMHLFRNYLEEQKEVMVAEGVRLKTIGDLSRFPQDFRRALDKTIIATEKGKKIDLVLALNYGARDEIRRAVASIARGLNQKTITEQEISEELISRHLDTAHLPDPDLLIRPSGESRLSNFLLWQISYTEIFVTDVLWPDFTEKDLHSAIAEYQKRESRIGR